jgi:hypothetical protein
VEHLYFSLDLSAAEYLRYYQGSAGRVLVRAHDGRRLSIPAATLRRFVSTEGIKGRFRVTLDPSHRLIALERQPD